MKAWILTGIRMMEQVEQAAPEIRRPNDVLLAVKTIGVCGSDIHYYTKGKIGSQVVEYPFKVGHECAARVVEVGAGVKALKVGDLVAVDPAISCHHCDQCLAGRPHTCRALRFLGCPGQVEGCLCEYIVMPEASCYPVASGVTAEQAALIEPFSIGCYAVEQAGNLAGKHVAVLGAGPIGLSVLLAARAAGAEAIYVTEPLDWRRAKAIELGAAAAGDPYEQNTADRIRRDVPFMLDDVFECCGNQEALDDAVMMLKPGGTLLVIGIPAVDRVSFPIDILRRHELTIRNIRRQNECVQRALDLAASGIGLESITTHRFDFSRAREAFDLVADYRDGVIKAMIEL